jgi:hypothetical protein
MVNTIKDWYNKMRDRSKKEPTQPLTIEELEAKAEAEVPYIPAQHERVQIASAYLDSKHEELATAIKAARKEYQIVDDIIWDGVDDFNEAWLNGDDSRIAEFKGREFLFDLVEAYIQGQDLELVAERMQISYSLIKETLAYVGVEVE